MGIYAVVAGWSGKKTSPSNVIDKMKFLRAILCNPPSPMESSYARYEEAAHNEYFLLPIEAGELPACYSQTNDSNASIQHMKQLQKSDHVSPILLMKYFLMLHNMLIYHLLPLPYIFYNRLSMGQPLQQH